MSTKSLKKSLYKSIFELVGDEGIYASGRNEVYGCIFGRDSAITILKLLDTYEITHDEKILEIAKKTLLTLASLQGKEINLENGEEPGKFIHEFRRERHEHLTSTMSPPWYLNKDKTMRNYDSIDSTPLGLIAMHRYFQITKDQDFLTAVALQIAAGLKWIVQFGDQDGDKLVEYTFHPERRHGGLKVQSWTDSVESLLQPNGKFPKYPIAPVEAQAYSWLALKLWADEFKGLDQDFADSLTAHANQLKHAFNKMFIFQDGSHFYAAQALDGNKNQIQTVTANPLLCLWASYKNGRKIESIIQNKYICDVVERAFEPDLFEKTAGIRTMSSKAATFNPTQNSYHNGSFWPFLNGLIRDGLIHFGYHKEARKLKTATLKPIKHFGSPIELYIKTESGYEEYKSNSGQVSCREQAWSAAALLHLVIS
ncbi:hypothetical protein HY024_04120 [Candidatus Curtissbacteria bacterium]|nr:hypothetical protein [Candidatus Curtissbacteria bacterium]